MHKTQTVILLCSCLCASIDSSRAAREISGKGRRKTPSKSKPAFKMVF